MLPKRAADCAALLKKRTLANLCNERPAWLDLTHRKLAAGLPPGFPEPEPLVTEDCIRAPAIF
jgi:hypothetical protein